MLRIDWFVSHPWPSQSKDVQGFTAIPSKFWLCKSSIWWDLLCWHCPPWGGDNSELQAEPETCCPCRQALVTRVEGRAHRWVSHFRLQGAALRGDITMCTVRDLTIFSLLMRNHCRTLEYLIKHLTHLASFSNMTNMHTRNLALVWAPNLLRYSRALPAQASCWAPWGASAPEPRDTSAEGKT